MKKYIVISVMSEFHLYGALSFIINNNLMNEKILIFSHFHPESNKYRVNEETSSFLKRSNVCIKYIKDYISILKDISPNKDECMLFICPMRLPLRIIPALFRRNHFKKISFVLIDEGIGSYRDNKFWNSIISKKTFCQFYIRDITKKILKFLYVWLFTNDIQNFFLFTLDYSSNNLIKNKEVIEAYRKYFLSEKEINEKETKRVENNSKKILFISSCLDRLCNLPDSNGFYTNLFEKVSQRFHDGNIYFKPHPIELNNVLKLDSFSRIDIITDKISVESLLEKYRFDYVLGFDSTALFSSALFFDIPTFTLVDWLPDELIKKEYFEHIQMYKKNIEKIDEIQRII